MIGGVVMNEKENFVFLASWAEAIEAYDKAGQPELGGELAKQIIYYGTSGQITTDNPLIEGFVKAMCVTLIDKSKKKYNTCKVNGNKGGRPESYPVEDMLKLRDAGLTDEEIADNLGCSVQTVVKKLKAIADSDDEI
jgi:hypothetical protein